MIPRDWTLFETSPAISLAADLSPLPGGSIHVKVRYHDHRTGEEGEIERVAPTLADCIHAIGTTIRNGSVSGRPARPGTADGVIELLWHGVHEHRARIDALLGQK